MPFGRSAGVHQALWRGLVKIKFGVDPDRFYGIGVPVFGLTFLRTVPHTLALRNNVVRPPKYNLVLTL